MKRVRILMALLPAFLVSAPINAWDPSYPTNNTPPTCNLPSQAVVPTSHTLSITGSDVTVQVQLSQTFGGVGTALTLINNQFPSNPVNILEPRASAGAGWQFAAFSYAVYTGAPVYSVTANQAVGNCSGQQWGQTNTLSSYQSPTLAYASPQDWAPNWSCNYQLVKDGPFSAASCPPGGTVVYDDGALDLAMATGGTPAGTGVLLTNMYSLRSRVNQYWTSYSPHQAMYFSRWVARHADMRVYLVGQSGWVEGPIRPYDAFHITHGVRTGPGLTQVRISSDLRYAVFVFNIFGLDVGVAVTGMQDGAALRLNLREYSSNSCDDTNGSIDWESFFAPSYIPNQNGTSVMFAAGVPRHYSIDYRIGTLPQLAAMGFPITGAVAPAPNPPVVSRFYKITPCRVLDSRSPWALPPWQTPEWTLSAACPRVLRVQDSPCGCTQTRVTDCIPSDAVALARNLTVIGGSTAGAVSIYPGDVGPVSPATAAPVKPGVVRATGGIDRLSTDGWGAILLTSTTTDPINFIYDVSGYFK